MDPNVADLGDLGSGAVDRPSRVLYAGEDARFAERASAALERQSGSFEVEAVADGPAVLERLDGERIDCVVSPHDAGGIDGLDLLSSVRERRPRLPFVLVVEDGSERIASRAIRSGVTDYLQWDAVTDEYAALADRVAEAVERYRTQLDRDGALERFRTLVEGTTDAILLVEESGTITYATPPTRWILGRPPEEIVGDRGLEGVHPEDEGALEETIEGLTGDSDATSSVEVRYRHPDGSSMWLEARGRGVGGVSAANAVVSVRDVTERKEYERRLETLVSNLPGIVYRCANERGWPMEFVGGECESLTGYPAAAFERGGIRWGRDVVHPDDRNSTWRSVQEALDADRPYEVTYRIRTKRGETRWVWERGRRIDSTEGGLDTLEGFITDVTQRKRRESERRERERMLAALHEATREMMTLDSVEGVAEVTIDAAAEILGLDRTSVHLYDEEADALPPVAVNEAVEEMLDEIPTLGPDSLAYETFQRQETAFYDDLEGIDELQNPETVLRSELIVPISEYGVLLASSVERDAFDTTHEQLAEVLCTNAAVAMERAEREEVLQRRERELERENHRLDRFTSVVSHDLRNPLNVANGRLELARQEVDSEHLEEVAAALDRMEALIERLLTLARHGETVDDPEAIGLAAIVDRCWANVATAQATLDVETEATVVSDRARLAQVFENLFRNAVEHGGDAVGITVGSLSDGFYVEDDGPGIPEAERDRIFEAGYSTVEEGTGFGLSIVDDIVDAHGWELTVTDGDAGGARFEIRGVETE